MTVSNPWFVRFRPTAAPRVRLFCLPYAGGSSALYARWHLGLPADVDAVAIELPGRGRRPRDGAFVTDMETLAEQIASQIAPLLDVPFAFFGHSMGATIAFAVTRALRRRGLPLPQQLIASARMAPQLGGGDPGIAAMSDAELIELLRARGGTPPQVLAEPELMALALPVVRADFALLGSFVLEPEPRLPCAITAFGGTRDERVTTAGLDGWRMHTSRAFAVEMFDGGHFFLDTARDAVIAAVGRRLAIAAELAA